MGYFLTALLVDFESSFSLEETPQTPGANLRFIEKHVPLSVSVCANIASYKKAKCYVRMGDEDIHVQNMVAEMLAYTNEINDHIYNLLLQSFQPTFQSLTAKINKDAVCENNSEKHKHPLTKF